MGKGYKNICKGQTRGNSFPCTSGSLKAWLEKGSICFVELVEVTKTEEYTSSVRRPKKQTGISTEVRQDTAAEGETYSATEPKAYTITEDTDTRDSSALWIVKFTERMSREEYQTTAANLKKIGGYYSKFKKGFIFRNDPATDLERLYSGTETETSQADPEERAAQEAAEREAREQAKQTAENIIDASTAIIADLRLRPGEYVINSKYKARLADYINGIRDQITAAVIEKIPYIELRAIVRIIFENEESGAA